MADIVENFDILHSRHSRDAKFSTVTEFRSREQNFLLAFHTKTTNCKRRQYRQSANRIAILD